MALHLALSIAPSVSELLKIFCSLDYFLKQVVNEWRQKLRNTNGKYERKMWTISIFIPSGLS